MSKRAKKKASPKSKKPRKPVIRRRPEPPHALDAEKALRAAAKGATAANVAKAAGSKAKNRKDLARTGRRILARLRDLGQIQDALAAHNVTIDRIAKNISRRIDAKRMQSVKVDDAWETQEVDDYQAQAKAVDQFVGLVGLSRMPAESTDSSVAPEARLSDEDAEALLSRLLDQRAGNG